MTVEKGIAENEKRICPLLFEIVESLLYIGFGAGGDKTDLYPERTSCLLCFAHLQLGIGVFGFTSAENLGYWEPVRAAAPSASQSANY